MKHILLVDDDIEYLDTISLTLKSFFDDIEVITTDDGNLVFDILSKNSIDLILLDMNMPKISGLKVAKMLKKEIIYKNIPIIFVTSASFVDFQKDGMRIGEADYISKPINKNILINRVGLYLTIIEQRNLLKEANSKLEAELNIANDMNKLHEEKLIHHSKTSVMAEMIGAVAHQWRQPLNIIATHTMRLETRSELGLVSDAEIKESSMKINATVQLLSKTIDNFRNFFRTSKEKDYINLVEVIYSVIELVDTQFRSHNIEINLEYDRDEEYQIYAYYSEMREVILNLLANSKDAIESVGNNVGSSDGVIEVRLNKVEDIVEMVICDNGGGIDSKSLSKIFNPYFTTKFTSDGTGIGLFLVKNIVEKFHGGVVRVYNSEDGACFKILLNKNS